MDQIFDLSKVDPKILDNDEWMWGILLLMLIFCEEDGWGKNPAEIEAHKKQ